MLLDFTLTSKFLEISVEFSDKENNVRIMLGCTATATACLFILTKQKQCNIASCELSKRLPAKQSRETDKGIVSRTAILDTPVLASTHTFIKCSEKLF